MAGLSRLQHSDSQGNKRLDREQLVAWARQRFDVEFDLEDVKAKQREEIRDVLLVHSAANQAKAQAALAEVEAKVDKQIKTGQSSTNGALQSVVDWMNSNYKCELSAERLSGLSDDQLRHELKMAIERRYRPEIRKLERMLLLDVVDETWKNHLLSMDHLRNSVGLRGYAQVDPKVEYKREGMRLFEQMWHSIGEQVTTLIFRMENLDENFVSQTFAGGKTVHNQASSAAELARQQQQEETGDQSDAKIEPFRHRGPRVGRNDPCPCGSGKKYKNCCLQLRGGPS
jgi:preprotein translocase subunit SecA